MGGKVSDAVAGVKASLEAVKPFLEVFDNAGAAREKVEAKLAAAEAKLAGVLAETKLAEAEAAAAKERLSGLKAEVDGKFKALMASKADELKGVQKQIDSKLAIVRSLEQQLREG